MTPFEEFVLVTKFFEVASSSSGFLFGNIVNRKPPQGGGGSFDQVIRKPGSAQRIERALDNDLLVSNSAWAKHFSINVNFHFTT